jgi:hypothetical protein
MKTIKCLLAVTVACASLVFASQASALHIGDSHELGFVTFGIPSGDQDRVDYVNAMIDLALGGSTVVIKNGIPNTVTRSMNDFGPLADAVFALDGTGTSINLGTGYDYLFAKYDGPNYGAEVWDVSGLTGVITIPATGGQYGLSGWTLFTPDGGNVPDGGATASLLGAALMGLAVLRARLQKA